jgi:transcriptional regulator with XRE-family HTH domain
MNYAKALKIIRALNNINQQELAAKIGVSKSLISKIESSKKNLSLDNKRKISRVFPISQRMIDILALDRHTDWMEPHIIDAMGRVMFKLSAKSDRETKYL